MSIKRYVATKDTTIADSFLENNIKKSTYSNMGAADSLEVFSISGTVPGSIEKSRLLLEFPINKILEDRNLSSVPSVNNVKFYLRLFNVEHPFSVPREFKLHIAPISQSWDEGYGLDMENYLDYGWNDKNINGSGANWRFRTNNNRWVMNNSSIDGGSYLTQSQYQLTYDFETGLEDLELDVTNIVEDWITNSIPNNGFLVKLSGSYEDGSEQTSFYTKKFSARGSEFFFKRPVIEARWEAISRDDRNNFFASSSALSAEDNKMNIYFYHKVNGLKKNIVGNILPAVKLYTSSGLNEEIPYNFISITNPSSGIYRAEIALSTTASVVYDKWYNAINNNIFFVGSFDVKQRKNYDYDNSEEYVVKITNNKLKYSNNENVKFRIFSRKKDWQPTIYSVATNLTENSILTDLYYKIFRLNDNYVIIDYSTGSLAYSKTSYDSNENYFELDMSIFEKDHSYGIKLARWDGQEIKELPTTFKFKVE